MGRQFTGLCNVVAPGSNPGARGSRLPRKRLLASRSRNSGTSALAGLVALLRLVDDVDPSFAADEAIVAMAIPEGPKGILDFHELGPARRGRAKTFDAQIGL